METPVKILAYLPQYVGYARNAGAELTMHELLFALRMRGHSVTVLLSERTKVDGPYVIDGIKVQPHSSKNDLFLHARESDVIISHLHPAERATLVANIHGLPSVQYIHNTHITTHQALETNPQLTVFNTEWISEAFAYRGNSMVLRPAVRPDSYRVAKGEHVTLVNLWRNKGVDVFYELAARNPSIPFLGVKGGYQSQLVLDLPNVTILENTDDMREVYRMTKVLLMPSAYESYGRVALEGAASGIPCISSGTQGLIEAMGPEALYAPAPQTNIPGGDPGPWDQEQFGAWDKALEWCLREYDHFSETASNRSSAVWTKTKQELTTFCEKVEGLV